MRLKMWTFGKNIDVESAGLFCGFTGQVEQGTRVEGLARTDTQIRSH